MASQYMTLTDLSKKECLTGLTGLTDLPGLTGPVGKGGKGVRVACVGHSA